VDLTAGCAKNVLGASGTFCEIRASKSLRRAENLVSGRTGAGVK
jgi:hypothetical protein